MIGRRPITIRPRREAPPPSECSLTVFFVCFLWRCSPKTQRKEVDLTSDQRHQSIHLSYYTRWRISLYLSNALYNDSVFFSGYTLYTSVSLLQSGRPSLCMHYGPCVQIFKPLLCNLVLFLNQRPGKSSFSNKNSIKFLGRKFKTFWTFET